MIKALRKKHPFRINYQNVNWFCHILAIVFTNIFSCVILALGYFSNLNLLKSAVDLIWNVILALGPFLRIFIRIKQSIPSTMKVNPAVLTAGFTAMLSSLDINATFSLSSQGPIHQRSLWRSIGSCLGMKLLRFSQGLGVYASRSFGIMFGQLKSTKLFGEGRIGKWGVFVVVLDRLNKEETGRGKYKMSGLTPRSRQNPQGRPPLADTPWADAPLGRHPPRQTPPPPDTTAYGQQTGGAHTTGIHIFSGEFFVHWT